MKRQTVAFMLLALCLAGIVYAQTRASIIVSDGETWFEKIGSAGSSATGNVGYIVLTGRDGADAVINYYLWVDNTGDLRIASYPTISAYASFPTGNWSLPNFAAGTVVGGQS